MNSSAKFVQAAIFAQMASIPPATVQPNAIPPGAAISPVASTSTKFQTKSNVKFGQNPGAQQATTIAQASSANQKVVERILTVNIQLMRTHMHDDSFNNVNTLLEFFAKVHKVDAGGTNSRVTRFTLRSLNSTHTMEAIYYQKRHWIRAGDTVRCVGLLDGKTGRFKILHISNSEIDEETPLIERLNAFTEFELCKSVKMK